MTRMIVFVVFLLFNQACLMEVCETEDDCAVVVEDDPPQYYQEPTSELRQPPAPHPEIEPIDLGAPCLGRNARARTTKE